MKASHRLVAQICFAFTHTIAIQVSYWFGTAEALWPLVRCKSLVVSQVQKLRGMGLRQRDVQDVLNEVRLQSKENTKKLFG